MSGLGDLAVVGAAMVLASSSIAVPTLTLTRPVQTCVSVPYVGGQEGYHTFRIPAVIDNGRGALLAFAEGRRAGGGDAGDIDIVVRASNDAGCTWSPLQVVASGAGDTIGNPAPVVDPASGDLVLLSTSNGGQDHERDILTGRAPARQVHLQRSLDGGRSFSPPQDISASTRDASWRWYATGPGHGIALRQGGQAGRLVIPANHSVAPPPGSSDTGAEPTYYGGHSLLSDDGGHTWRIGFVDDHPDGALNPNESSAAELPDGGVYVTARDQDGATPGNRLGLISSDGAAGFDAPYAPVPDLDQVPVVQGSVLQTRRAGRADQGLFFAGPSRPTARREMAIWRSDDAGGHFRLVHRVSGDPAAYSDLVQLDRERVGLLYETGVSRANETITFVQIALADLRG